MLIDLTQAIQAPLTSVDKTLNDPLIQRAQKWFQDHLTEQLRMTDLAQMLAVSERTLLRRFNMVFGQSPLTYLQSLRIDTARALLETGDLSIERIAQNVGYNDTCSFSRLFRDRVGYTPGVYRARYQLPQAD